ncbi:MAG: serine hydrolase domain-containing protein [Lapillicoccus sp.]
MGYRTRRLVAAVGVPALLLAAGCSSGGSAPGGAAATTSATSASSSATTAGAQALAATYRPIVQSAMKEMLVPGAVVLIDTPQGRWTEAFGVRTLGGTEPVTALDHFRIGSNTKTMVGTVVLQLVQEGKLKLEDPISRFEPDVPNGGAITIAQMLAMTSGLDSYTFLESFEHTLDTEPQKVWNPQDLARMGEAMPPKFAPGAGFLYSNTNTVLLGLVIEKLTGQTLEQALNERVYAKLGLKNTSFPALVDNALPSPHPHGYMFGTNVSTLVDAALPAAEQAAARAGTLKPNDHTDDNPSWGWAAGAAISTADDLAVYAKALATGGLLDPATQKTRVESLKPVGSGTSAYGLALARYGAMIGHDGSLPGYQSLAVHNPKTSTTLVVLTNLQLSVEGQTTAKEIGNRIMATLPTE